MTGDIGKYWKDMKSAWYWKQRYIFNTLRGEAYPWKERNALRRRMASKEREPFGKYLNELKISIQGNHSTRYMFN